MYPFTTPTGTLNVGTSTKPNCYDNSPTFAEQPAAIICTDYEFTYNHNAVDQDLDSLDYKWAPSWQAVNSSIAYTSGFSYNTPLPNPGAPFNLNNISATVNPQTGEISFLSYDAGRFYTNIQVDAYKCGQLVASIFREIPVNLLSCPPLPPPFPPNTVNTPPNVSLTYNNLPPTTNLSISVLAGEEVEFEVAAIDLDFLPGFIQQSVRMKPTGYQFGANYADSLSGCRYPPCAIMDVTPPPLGSYIAADKEWKKVTQLSSDFYWRTDCNHLARSVSANGFSNCFTASNVYTFVFKILDDYCPAPGANFVTASVTVNAPDPLEPPVLKCVSVANNGDVSLSWNIPVPEILDTNNSFRKYVIFRASKRDTSDYTAIDTITNIATSSYTDVGANAHVLPKHYFIMGVSSCNDASQRIWTDTITTLTLSVIPSTSGDSVYISWPHFVKGGSFPSTTTGEYNLYEIYNGDTNLISQQTGNTYDNAVTTCNGGSKCYPSDITYFVTVEDTTSVWGCTSYSNYVEKRVGDQTPPVAPNLVYATIQNPGGAQLSWNPSADCDVRTYYIWENGVIIDSVPATDTSYFRSFTPATVIGHPPITYAISGIDSCGNNGSAGLDHITMQAFVSSVSRCATDKRISVRMTAYSGRAVTSYVLFADTGLGAFPVDTVTVSPVVTFPYTFNDTSVNTSFYTYFVRAYDGNTMIAESSRDTLSMSVVTNYVVDPPSIRCIRREANGDVVIEWEKPLSPDNNFDSYQIFHSTDGTNYSLLDSIVGNSRSDNQALDSTRYTHGNPGPGQHYYKVYSRSGCDGFELSAASNITETISLSVNPLASNVNELTWNFLPQPTSGMINVMKDYPTGSGFSVKATLPNTSTSITDTVNACDDSAHYQIIVPDSKGCESYSRVKTGIYKDQQPPAKQFLDSVTVTNDTNTTLGWSKNPSPDVVLYYVVRRTPGGGFTVIDTIGGAELKYTDFGYKECIAIVAEDSCGNNSLSSGDFNYHCPIETRVKVDRCDQSFLIQWNAYKTFTSGPEVQYNVYMSENGLGYELLGSTSSNNYRFAEPISGNSYCFYVQAIEDGGNGPFTSTSDSTCITSEFLVTPEYSYLLDASVVDTNRILVRAWVDLRADVSEYLIQRGLDSTKMKTIHTIEVPKILTPADSTIAYEDKTPSTALKAYYYKVVTIDPCGEEIAQTNLGRSILLEVKANNESKSNILDWSSYLEWAGGVQSYKIYRATQDGTPKFVATVEGNVYTYTDDVSQLIEQSEGRFCYYVEANEGSPLFPGVGAPSVSRSNKVCVVQYPLFYIPTAFTPGEGNSPGLNDIFKPEGVFVDLENYSFEVFNRWGEKVYSTEDFSEGWDGEIDGKPAPLGAYVYIVKYQGADGTQYQQEGTVNLTK